MKKSQLYILAGIGIVLIGGVVIFFFREDNLQFLLQSEKQGQDSQERRTADAQTGNETIEPLEQKVYRNERYGFEFQYPDSLVLNEVNNEIDFSEEYGVPNGSVTTFRYVLLKSLEDDFTVSIGVKNKNDDSVSIRQWRTGVAAGDFRKSKIIHIGGGTAEQMELSYQGEINGLVWFCGSGTVSGECSDIDLKNGKKAFIEIDFSGEEDPQSARWRSIEKNVHEIIGSFRTF